MSGPVRGPRGASARVGGPLGVDDALRARASCVQVKSDLRGTRNDKLGQTGMLVLVGGPRGPPRGWGGLSNLSLTCM